MKKKRYGSFYFKTLKIKPWLTLFSILLNIAIFCYASVNISCLRWILNSLQESIRGQGILHRIWPCFVIMALNCAFRCLCIKASAYVDVLRSYYYQDSLRLQFFRSLLQSSRMKDRAANAGKTFERLDDDVPAAVFPAELITEVTGYMVYTLVAIGSLLLVNWKITLFIFLPLSLCLFLIRKLSGRIGESRRRNRAMHDYVSDTLADIVTAVLTIKTMGGRKSVLKRYDSVLEQRTEALVKDNLFQATVNSAVDIASVICVAAMMAGVAGLMRSGRFPLGDFSIFICYLDTLNDCILRIIELYTETKKAEVSWHRIAETAGEENIDYLGRDGNLIRAGMKDTSRVSLPETDLPPAFSGNLKEPFRQLEVKNLSCIYEDGRGVRDVGFTLHSGEILVLSGPVASGKSTVLNALLGIVPRTLGEIRWNAEEQKDPFSLFRPPHAVCCLQNSHLQNATIRENLTMGRDYTDEACLEALEKGCIAEEIMHMPDGLHTLIGENGVMLSGGQKQRLLLSRMFLVHAGLYLLDDATSALDLETEKKLMANLKERVLQDKAAAIIVTGSKAAEEMADRIVSIQLPAGLRDSP
nr:ABC transporter ATP-binding protein [uncultured Eisenbergiella sp.]